MNPFLGKPSFRRCNFNAVQFQCGAIPHGPQTVSVFLFFLYARWMDLFPTGHSVAHIDAVGITMLAAEAFQPYEIDTPGASLNNQAWNTCPEHVPPGLAQRQAMKLLDLENVRSLLLRSVCRKGPPSRNGNQNVPHAPETNGLEHSAAAVAMDPSGVNSLLALDVEELVRHTSRLQRERHTSSYVRYQVSGCLVLLIPNESNGISRSG